MLFHFMIRQDNTGSGTGARSQYNFEYIAPYVKSTPVVDPEKIRWLKNVTSKFVVQGQLIPDIIDTQIQLHCENKPMYLDGAMKAFLKKSIALQRYSQRDLH